MLGLATDLPEALCVWVFTGPHNSDADFEQYLASIRRLDEACRGRELPAGILVADPGNPPPNATWRRRIADETRSLATRPLFAMVTTSLVLRGVVTAINWIRPPPYEFATFERFDDALAWVEARRGRKLAIGQRLLAEARASVGAASRS